MKRFVTLVLALLVAAFASGCATLPDAQAAKGSGTAKVYDKPYDVVWYAVLAVVKTSGLSLVSENKEKGNILAEGKISAFSWGENVAIFVQKLGDGTTKTRVEVVNKRALATNITAKDWEGRIFEDLDKRL